MDKLDLTQADINFEEKLVNYCAKNGLMNCRLKQTVHGTIGAFYYGNSNYICEINHIPDDGMGDRGEFDRCVKWVDSFISNLKVQRTREAEQNFFIRIYIWFRRFLDPGYIFPFKEKWVSSKLESPFKDIPEKETKEPEVNNEIFVKVKQVVENLKKTETFDKIFIKQKDNQFFIVTKKINGNEIKSRAFDSAGKELAGMELARILDIPAFIDYNSVNLK